MRIQRKLEKVRVLPFEDAARVFLTEDGNEQRQLRRRITLSDAVEINRALNKTTLSPRFESIIAQHRKESKTLTKVELLPAPGDEFYGMTCWEKDGKELWETCELTEAIVIALVFDRAIFMDEVFLEMFKTPIDEVKFSIKYLTKHLHQADIRAEALSHLQEMEFETLNTLMSAATENEEYLFAAAVKKEIELRLRAMAVKKEIEMR